MFNFFKQLMNNNINNAEEKETIEDDYEKKAAELEITVDYYIAEFT